MHKDKTDITFRRFALWTVISVLFLILVGAIVRATGSGMGCPDWPKCFGLWIPPTDVSQLPINYLQKFSVNGHLVPFNPLRTWIEYINRIIGASIGILVFLTFIFSLAYWSTNKKITILSFLAFILVGLEGWIGAKVVATHLSPWIITIHLALSFIILGILIFAVIDVNKDQIGAGKYYLDKKSFVLFVILIGATLIQIFLGTQVRQVIDVVSLNMDYQFREMWASQLGLGFYLHRSFSVLVLVLTLWFSYSIYKSESYQAYKSFLFLWWVILGGEVLIGILLYYCAFPAFLQPLHLFLAVLLLGLQFWMISLNRISVKKIEG